MAVQTFLLLRNGCVEDSYVLQVLLHALLVPLGHAVVGQEDVENHHQHLQQADTDWVIEQRCRQLWPTTCSHCTYFQGSGC